MTDKKNMGIGSTNEIKFVKKNRYVCEIPKYDLFSFIKLNERPSILIKETDEKIYYSEWDNVSLTFYDYDKTIGEKLYTWFASMYLNEEINTTNFKTDVMISSYNGIGERLEKWTLKNAWLKSINFGDFHENEFIEVELVYDKACYENEKVKLTTFHLDTKSYHKFNMIDEKQKECLRRNNYWLSLQNMD